MKQPRSGPVLAFALVLGGLMLPGTTAAQTAALPIPVAADAAREKISVVVTPGITRTRQLPTAALRALRKTMVAGTDLPDADLRALADRGDGLAALKYLHRLTARGAAPSDIAFYGTVAVRTGRIVALPATLAALRQLDPATEPSDRKTAYLAMLLPHAWAGNTLALDGVIDLNGADRLFGPLSEATRQRLLDTGRTIADGRVVLRLALALWQIPDRSAADDAHLIAYLIEARAAPDLGMRTVATNLLATLEAGSVKTAAAK